MRLTLAYIFDQNGKPILGKKSVKNNRGKKNKVANINQLSKPENVQNLEKKESKQPHNRVSIFNNKHTPSLVKKNKIINMNRQLESHQSDYPLCKINLKISCRGPSANSIR